MRRLPALLRSGPAVTHRVLAAGSFRTCPGAVKDAAVGIVTGTAIATTVSFPTLEDGMAFPLIPIRPRMRDTRTRNPTIRVAPPSSTDAGEEIELMFLHHLML